MNLWEYFRNHAVVTNLSHFFLHQYDNELKIFIQIKSPVPNNCQKEFEATEYSFSFQLTVLMKNGMCAPVVENWSHSTFVYQSSTICLANVLSYPHEHFIGRIWRCICISNGPSLSITFSPWSIIFNSTVPYTFFPSRNEVNERLGDRKKKLILPEVQQGFHVRRHASCLWPLISSCHSQISLILHAVQYSTPRMHFLSYNGLGLDSINNSSRYIGVQISPTKTMRRLEKNSRWNLSKWLELSMVLFLWEPKKALDWSRTRSHELPMNH